MKFSYHTHSTFCDGRADLDRMAERAAHSGYRILGFSSHAPLPFETTWNLPAARLNEYRDAVRACARTWKPRGLDILLGLETDWIEGLCAPSDSLFSSIDPDYRIGSVHFVRMEDGAEAFAVDEPETEFLDHLRALAEGDGRRVWHAYYRNMAAMIGSGGFDILGHFDLVRKNNGQGRLFDESDPAYRDTAFQVADLAASGAAFIEINTGGVARGKTDRPYPSLDILRRLREKGARITLGDDAHAPDHLGPYVALAVEHARQAGYRTVWYMDAERKWRELPLDEVG